MGIRPNDASSLPRNYYITYLCTRDPRSRTSTMKYRGQTLPNNASELSKKKKKVIAPSAKEPFVIYAKTYRSPTELDFCTFIFRRRISRIAQRQTGEYSCLLRIAFQLCSRALATRGKYEDDTQRTKRSMKKRFDRAAIPLSLLLSPFLDPRLGSAREPLLSRHVASFISLTSGAATFAIRDFYFTKRLSRCFVVPEKTCPFLLRG